MKFYTRTPVEVTHVLIDVPVRYDDEDIPYDFPLRSGDQWRAVVEVGTGQILDWPQEIGPEWLFMKVVDGGSYTLLDAQGNRVASIEGDYVPHGLIPGAAGDYIDLKINEGGVIKNWPRNPDLSAWSETE